MHFDPVTFFLGLRENRLASLTNDGFEGKDVFLVGSGPSIDHTDLAAIRDSFVIFLNSSFSLAPNFGAGNSYYWFCQDTTALLKLISHIPPQIRKLVTIHRFNKYLKVRKHMGAQDRFLQPRLSMRNRTSAQPWSLRAWIPRPAMNSGPPYLHDKSSGRLTLFRSSVMLTAISMFGGLGAKDIYCMGFDLTPAEGEINRISKMVNQPYQTGKLPLDSIIICLEGLLREMVERDQGLWNCSPLTHDRVLPKIGKYNKQA